ncbi:MAG: DUF3592 domain-containing protein [Myxococcales bacterium]|nr:DUF3592 domain-containing protein [Myxococcales bacterium]
MDPYWLLIVGVLGVVFGTPWLVIGLLERRRERALRARGRRVAGTIVGSVTYPNEDDLQSGQHRLLVEYVVDGVTYTLKSRLASSGGDGREGEAIGVVHDPEDPDRSRLEMDLDAGPPVWRHLAIVLIGLALVLAALFSDP